jgi:hypothetical protein
LVGKSERKPLERPRHIWEDIIRMDIREIGLERVDLTHLAQYRDQLLTLVNTVMKLQVT